MIMLRNDKRRGQAMVELALVLPLFTMLLVGIITLGIGAFYQQQVTNAAREGARFAAIHSATARCPTVPRLPYDPASPPLTYTRCDRPEDGWPAMTAQARARIFGLPKSAVQVAACWSGYRLGGGTGAYDAPPPGAYDFGTYTETDSVFAQCLIGGQDPTTNPDDIPCTAGLGTTDEASSISEAPSRPVSNTVTAYACYVWQPPLAGFLLLPDQVTLRAVITEAIQRQQ
jgi:TadE-like protein